MALIAGLTGIYLWFNLVAAPVRLATGLLESADHLERAERTLSDGRMRAARYETLAAGAAADRARGGLDGAGPILDLAALVPEARAAIGQIEHFVRAAEHSASAAGGTLAVADDALEGGLVKEDPENPRGSIIDLDRVQDLSGLVGTVKQDIGAARDELAAVDLGALPDRLHDRVEDGIEKAAEAIVRLTDAETGLRVLPSILGANGPRTYLIGFQNTSEQRGTGGAILQFTFMTLEDGRLTLETEGGAGREDEREGPRGATTVYDIDRGRRQFQIPLPDDAWIVAGIPDAQRFGNSNWSPDWPTSARLMIAYAEAAAEAYDDLDLPDIDGFIAVDPLALEKMMPGVGPFAIRAGNRITSGNVVHFVLYRAYSRYPRPIARRAVLRQVVEEFFSKAMDPPNPGRLVRGTGEAMTSKNVQIWMANEAEQAFIDSMGWDAGIKPARGADYLYVVEQNVGGNKLDFFDRHANTFDIEIDGDDSVVSAELRVRNGVFLPQPRWILGDSARGSQAPFHRPMMSLYVPGRAELESAAVEGTRIDTPAPAVWSGGSPPENSESGKKVWSATLEIQPSEEAAVRFGYRVPAVVRERGNRKLYQLVVQHQPKVNPETLAITLRLPDEARRIRVDGWKRDGRVLTFEDEIRQDTVLEVSWRS